MACILFLRCVSIIIVENFKPDSFPPLYTWRKGIFLEMACRRSRIIDGRLESSSASCMPYLHNTCHYICSHYGHLWVPTILWLLRCPLLPTLASLVQCPHSSQNDFVKIEVTLHHIRDIKLSNELPTPRRERRYDPYNGL